MKEWVIAFEHVWKSYPLHRDHPGFKEFMVNLHKFLRRNNKENHRFCALRDLTLRIERGECVGIIGKNGAGKSTLLSLMLGTLLPSKGEVKILDRVTPLLELGAGFHPDFTGRENVIRNGVLLGFTKKEVREVARRMGLPTWDKPSLACLASRIPYGTRIDPGTLRRLDEAERFLKELGFRQVRVRHHGDIARIEVEPEEIERLTEPKIRRRVTDKFKELQYLYTTLDLGGYRMGSMNAVLNRQKKA